MLHPKIDRVNKRILLLLIVLVISSCQPSEPKNVELIVPGDEVVEGRWILSPEGNKLIYRHRETQDHLIILPLRQDYLLQNIIGEQYCGSSSWLDEVYLFCWNGRWEPYIFDTDDFSKVSIQRVNAETVDVDALLQTADAIYRYERDNHLLLLSPDFKHNADQSYWITGVEEMNALLEAYDHQPLLEYREIELNSKDGKLYSPNGLYYFRRDDTFQDDKPHASLAIYQADNNKKLSETVIVSPLQVSVQGWAGDSSGVYFEPSRAGLPLDTKKRGIRKLIVPQ